MPEALRAADLLTEHRDVAADVVGDQLGRTQPRRRQRGEGTPSGQHRRGRARRVRHRRCRTPAARRWRSATGCARCPSRSASGCPTPTSRWGPTVRLLRHPPGGRRYFKRGCRVGGGRGARRRCPRRRDRPSVAVAAAKQVSDRRRAVAPASLFPGPAAPDAPAENPLNTFPWKRRQAHSAAVELGFPPKTRVAFRDGRQPVRRHRRPPLALLADVPDSLRHSVRNSTAAGHRRGTGDGERLPFFAQLRRRPSGPACNWWSRQPW